MKKYISAEMAVVRLANDVIATSLSQGTVESGDSFSEGEHDACAPTRRHYRDSYDY